MERASAPSNDKRFRVLVADGDERVRSALRFLLGWTDDTEVVGEVSAIEPLLREAGTHRPDVIVLDWGMARGAAAGLVPDLHLTHPGVLVVALSLAQEERAPALAAGVNAFVCKLDGPAALLETIRELVRGVPPTAN